MHQRSAARWTIAMVLALGSTAVAGRRDLLPPGAIETLTGPQPGDPADLAVAFAHHRAEALGLTDRDFDELLVVDSYRSRASGVTHVYLRQHLDGIPVFHGDLAVHVASDGSILKANSLLVGDLRGSASAVVRLDATAAVEAAAGHLGLRPSAPLVVEDSVGGPERAVRFAPAGISLEPIPARLTYVEVECEARLAWSVRIYPLDAQHWWTLLIDAETGAVVGQHDWVDRDSYRVYELPAPSPRHITPPPPADGRVLPLDPADPTASPYGWHSTTETPGEFRSTRGNNVDAYEDQDSSNGPTGGDAARAIGTAARDFDFPIDFSRPPADSVDAAITNVFYVNNAIHDVLHRYGFDEASGNFQVNNYGRGGDGNDDVQAEAQDGGGRNNANFATPIDGMRPTMQMYLWDPPSDEVLRVHTPIPIARDYQVRSAAFGPGVPSPPGLTGNVVLVDDGVSPDRSAGCAPFVNAAEVAGNIALVRLAGGCNPDTKAANAEAAGAIALVVRALDPRVPLFRLVGSSTPGIPVVMIGYSDGETIFGQLPGVSATLLDPSGPDVIDLDCSFDTEIVVHEYAHGVSNRLVGGRLNVNCLDNSEQAGEGWSDLLALMLTVRPGDAGTDSRGLATYSAGQPTSGRGLRGFPYSTDMAVSPRTYGDIRDLAIPHETGSVWASAGWEVYWAMVDRYGFDPDLIGGSSGNNMTIQLILDGMKLGPCSPGFVDNRDAILIADLALYGGANECLLWQAFAKRGLGFSADQGTTDVGDETEAFDLPPQCICSPPVEQGNVLTAWHGLDPLDVELDFRLATGSRWRLFRDLDKRALRTTPLTPDPVTTRMTDVGAADPAVGPRLYYRLAEVDCLGNAGP